MGERAAQAWSCLAAPTAAQSVTMCTMKVGLVLGAGGIQGGAWLTGGLDALAAGTG